MEFDIGEPLTSFLQHCSDTIPDLLASESDHMPSLNFTRDFYVCFRREAISIIFQAQFSCNFDPFVSYLAVNYMDRFVSKQDITEKPWLSRLLVVASISLAAKMNNSPFSLSYFQREEEEEGFNFDSQTVHKMEIHILDTLSWRMRSITPFSFLYFFVSFFELKDPTLTQALKDRASEIIFDAHNEMEFLEYKPSIIAASALVSASKELCPPHFTSFKASVSACQYINTESLLKCLNLMQEIVMVEGYESIIETLSSTTTPISVLDRKLTNSESENNSSTTNNTGVDGAIAVAEKREIKRRKLNMLCSSKSRFQLSQWSNQW